MFLPYELQQRRQVVVSVTLPHIILLVHSTLLPTVLFPRVSPFLRVYLLPVLACCFPSLLFTSLSQNANSLIPDLSFNFPDLFPSYWNSLQRQHHILTAYFLLTMVERIGTTVCLLDFKLSPLRSLAHSAYDDL